MNKLTAIFHQVTDFAKNKHHDTVETVRDIFAALRNDKALSPHQRHLDEFKLFAGGALTAAGAVELNPLAAAGGSIPFVEATNDLRIAGHKYRRQHHLL